jgi:hypothetical protein
MYTFGLYTLAFSPCFLSPLAQSLLHPLLILFTYLETLLAAIGSVHPGPRLLVNWSPHLHPCPSAPHLFPICFPFRNPDPLWFSQVNAPLLRRHRNSGFRDQHNHKKISECHSVHFNDFLKAAGAINFQQRLLQFPQFSETYSSGC